MQTTTKELASTTIYGITRRPVDDGLLPAGTVVTRIVSVGPPEFHGDQNITFVIRQADGREFLQSSYKSDLIKSGISVE